VTGLFVPFAQPARCTPAGSPPSRTAGPIDQWSSLQLRREGPAGSEGGFILFGYQVFAMITILLLLPVFFRTTP